MPEMPPLSRLQLLEEADKRGILPSHMKSAFDEAKRRGITLGAGLTAAGEEQPPSILPPLGPEASPFEAQKRWGELQANIPEFGDMTAERARSPEPPSMGQNMLIAEENNRRAALQGVSPYVEDMKVVAPVSSEDDSGYPYYKDASGKEFQVEPSRHLVFRDPASGRLTVYERDPKFSEFWLKSLGRLILPGMATGPLTGPLTYLEDAAGVAPVLTRAPAVDRATRIAQGSEALEAFQRQGVKVPGFVFSSGPVAATGRQLIEMPFLGAPVRAGYEGALESTAIKAGDIARGIGQAATDEQGGQVAQNALRSSLEQTAGRVQGVANDLAPNASHFDTGRALQAGLERATGADLAQLEPGTVEALGIPANAQVARPLTMSQGAVETAEQAAPVREALGQPFVRRGEEITSIPTQTARGVLVPSALPRDLTLITRTTPEMLDDQQLARVVNAPAAQTSFAARAEALYERAWRMLPAMMRAETATGRVSANPNVVAAVNTRQALGAIDRSIANQIAGQGTITGDLAERLRNPRAANFTMADLRSIRSEVGRAIGRLSPLTAGGPDAVQLNQLYGAITRDMEIGFETIANRALIRSRLSNNRSDYVPQEVATRAAGALRAFRTADRYYRAGKVRFERFGKILNAQNPEQAAKIILNATKDQGKGNLDLIRTAFAVLRPEERNEVSSLVLREMGRPAAAATDMEKAAGFSADAFTKNFADMHPAVRNLVIPRQHMDEINQALAEADRWNRLRALAKADKPDQIFESIWRMTQRGPNADVPRLRAIKQIMKPDEWDDLRAAIIQRLGRPDKGAKGFIAKLGWSPTKMATNLAGMHEGAKSEIFTSSHLTAIEDIGKMAVALADIEDLANKSRSLSNAMGISQLMAAASVPGAIMTGSITSGMVLGPAFLYGASLLLSRPIYARWALNYAKLRLGVAASAKTAADLNLYHRRMAAHLNNLARMARSNSDLVPIWQNFARENGVDEGSKKQKQVEPDVGRPQAQ